jgi:hypothetical protein
MEPLLNVAQLAAALHKTVASIQSDASRNPAALPPICRLPGNRRLLWRVKDVEKWIADHVRIPDTVASTPPAIPPSPAPVTPKRGRPTKAEQLRRARGRPATPHIRSGAD